MNAAIESDFHKTYNGYLKSILKWDDLDRLFETVVNSSSSTQWYIYATGESCPDKTSSNDELKTFTTAITNLLKQEHHHDYCGIVYTDNIDNPSMIKVYDPNNLGSVCGSSSLPPPLPGWVLSTSQPDVLDKQEITPANRKRWWQSLFS